MRKALEYSGILLSHWCKCAGIMLALLVFSTEIQAQVVAYRVNAGGRVYVADDASYPDWSADEQAAVDPPPILFARNGIPSMYVNEEVAGDQTAGKSQSIDISNVLDGGAPEIIFRTQRWNIDPPTTNLAYTFPVTSGSTYNVVLYFTELFGAGLNTREFDVLIEGVIVEDNLDILEETGNDEKVVVVKQHEVTVLDDMLEISFTNQTELPAIISAIEIVDMTSQNQSPLVTNPGDQFNDPEDTAELQIVASDPDESQSLSYTAEGLPPGLSIDASTGFISGTIPAGTNGLFTTRVIVVDDGDPPAGTIIEFEWGVGSNPIVVNPIQDISVDSGVPDEIIDLTQVFDDPSGLDLTFSVESNTNSDIVGAIISESGTDLVLDYVDSGSGTSTITVRATNTAENFAEDQFVVTVSSTPSAELQVTPTTTLGGSTFDGGSFILNNNSSGNVLIEQVTIDLSSSLFPDMVFDPVGAAGDSGAKCLSANSGATETGFTVPTDPCVDPFGLPKDNGFLEMTFSFTDFNPGETFTFSVDVDPTSIRGNPGVGDAGSVGGVEMIGTAVTVQFSDNTTVTNDLFYLPGSEGGGQAIIGGEPSVAPSIELEVAPGSETATVDNLIQNIIVSAPSGSPVRIFQVDGRLNLEGTPDGGFDIDPFEANEAVGVVATYTATVGGDGTVAVPVVLKRSFFGGAFTGGLNHFIAVVEDSTPGRTSNRLIVELQGVSTASFVEGWNLIGLSNTVSDNNYQALYSGISPLQAPFEWNGVSYVQTDNLLVGNGYWLEAGAAGSVTINGTEVSSVSVSVQEGWNMISGPSCAIPVEEILDPNTVIIPQTLFRYEGFYQNASSVEPNVGYWIEVTGSGTLTLDCEAASGLFKTASDSDSDVLASFGALLVKDQSGGVQWLRFGGQLEGGAESLSFSVPPLSPSGFDARFANNTRLIEANSGLITLRSDAFPVTVELESMPQRYKADFVVETITSNNEIASHQLVEGDQLQISNKDVVAIRILESEETLKAIPGRFVLDGNYPNPFNPTTNIAFDLPEDATMRVDVYDLLGRRVLVVDAVERSAGAGRQISIDASSLASGTYIYRVQAQMANQNIVETGQMTVLK